MSGSIPAWLKVARRLIRRLPAGRYRAANALSRSIPLSPFWGDFLCDDWCITFQCNLRDSIAREVFFTGLYEAIETRILLEHLKAGDVFVDVGANWGYFSLLAARKVGPTGRVLSLEPDLGLHEQFVANIERNNFSWITPLAIAASDKKGIAKFTGSSANAGNSGLNRLLVECSREDSNINLPTDTLDSILDPFRPSNIDLMKMDIEGAEALALPGMSETLATRRIKRLLLEMHPQLLEMHGTCIDALFDFIISFGYEGFFIRHDPQSVRHTSYNPAEPYTSYLQPWTPKQHHSGWPHFLFVLKPLNTSNPMAASL